MIQAMCRVHQALLLMEPSLRPCKSPPKQWLHLMAVACFAMALLKSELPLLQTYLITRKVCKDVVAVRGVPDIAALKRGRWKRSRSPFA